MSAPAAVRLADDALLRFRRVIDAACPGEPLVVLREERFSPLAASLSQENASQFGNGQIQYWVSTIPDRRGQKRAVYSDEGYQSGMPSLFFKAESMQRGYGGFSLAEDNRLWYAGQELSSDQESLPCQFPSYRLSRDERTVLPVWYIAAFSDAEFRLAGQAEHKMDCVVGIGNDAGALLANPWLYRALQLHSRALRLAHDNVGVDGDQTERGSLEEKLVKIACEQRELSLQGAPGLDYFLSMLK